MWQPSDSIEIPFGDWVQEFVRGWLVPNFRDFFRMIQWPVDQTLSWLDGLLNATPMLLFAVILTAIAWGTAGQ
ncbi:MAG: Fatty acid desaturase [Rhodobacteraceae bacterium HLUCCO07]|nr:MAG: Fatty acid desaturase [Rhodobacteraceae bacterium HLUCCO07]